MAKKKGLPLFTSLTSLTGKSYCACLWGWGKEHKGEHYCPGQSDKSLRYGDQVDVIDGPPELPALTL